MSRGCGPFTPHVCFIPSYLSLAFAHSFRMSVHPSCSRYRQSSFLNSLFLLQVIPLDDFTSHPHNFSSTRIFERHIHSKTHTKLPTSSLSFGKYPTRTRIEDMGISCSTPTRRGSQSRDRGNQSRRSGIRQVEGRREQPYRHMTRPARIPPPAPMPPWVYAPRPVMRRETRQEKYERRNREEAAERARRRLKQEYRSRFEERGRHGRFAAAPDRRHINMSYEKNGPGRSQCH